MDFPNILTTVRKTKERKKSTVEPWDMVTFLRKAHAVSTAEQTLRSEALNHIYLESVGFVLW